MSRRHQVSAAAALAAIVCACACGPGDGAAPRAAAVVRPPWRVRGPGGLEPIEPGTRDPSLLAAGACAACHPAEHAEWATSRHAAAWTNRIFQREYRDNPRRWCVHCHAPMTPQVDQIVTQREGPAGLADEGVTCAACHVRAGRMVSRRRAEGSPHDTIARADFGSADFCADCHQFPFPRFGAGGAAVALTEHPMQDTVAQFRRGPFGGASHGCLDCHGSPASHAFPGAHDPAMLAAAIQQRLCRDGATIVIELENVGAGHRVPTGDVHHHIVARLWRPSAPESLAEVFVGRRFANDPAGGKRTIWDTSLPPRSPLRWRFALADLGGDEVEPLHVELRYVYTIDELPRRGRDPGEPTVHLISERAYELDALPRCGAPAAPPAAAAAPDIPRRGG